MYPPVEIVEYMLTSAIGFVVKFMLTRKNLENGMYPPVEIAVEFMLTRKTHRYLNVSSKDFENFSLSNKDFVSNKDFESFSNSNYVIPKILKVSLTIFKVSLTIKITSNKIVDSDSLF